jgi:hypothetical protein
MKVIARAFIELTLVAFAVAGLSSPALAQAFQQVFVVGRVTFRL